MPDSAVARAIEQPADFHRSGHLRGTVLTRSVPLCVDLDGTLVAADTLWETLVRIALRHPLALIACALAMLGGKAKFKAVASRTLQLNPELLPYRKELLTYLREQRAQGRRLFLVTAADQSIADAVSSHFHGLFESAFGSIEGCNLKGEEKASFLVERFGQGRFSYAGNCSSDLEVWRHAASAIVVAANPAVSAEVSTHIEAQFPVQHSGLRPVLRSIRVHQWVKNSLVFLPLLTSRDIGSLHALGSAAVVALALSLIASAQYLLNDLIDIDADRSDPDKKRRPLASGELPIAAGLLLVPCLLACGMMLAWLGSTPSVVALLGFYFAASLCYSKLIKTKPLVDVFCLSGLYVLRIVIGGVTTNHPVSNWLLTFSFFCFLGLSLLKRSIELTRASSDPMRLVGRRGYQVSDAPILNALGIGVSVASVVVLALYVHSESANVIYARPSALWGLVPLCLLVQCRWWLAASRGFVAEDPVKYAISDKVLWFSALLSAFCYVLATGHML